jgi:DNA-directed RNA polymerase subunit RPC12/RpoP
MIYELSCPHCQRMVSADGNHVGRLVRCPHCQGQFLLPAPRQEAPAGEEPVGPASVPAGAQTPLTPSGPAGPPLYRFHFACSRCGSVLEGNTGQSRRTGQCPTCAAEFVVPDLDTATGAVGKPVLLNPETPLPTPMHAYAAAGARAPEIIRTAEGRQFIRCPRCEQISPVDANTCAVCGLPFTLEGVSSASHPDQRNGYAIASLVMSLLGLPCGVLIVPQILGVAFGLVSLRQIARNAPLETGRGMATAGILLSLASLAATVGLFAMRVMHK